MVTENSVQGWAKGTEEKLLWAEVHTVLLHDWSDLILVPWPPSSICIHTGQVAPNPDISRFSSWS
jgi:hypothetical protein